LKNERDVFWSDTRLVEESLQGSGEAWFALIEKYKNLIFSIPIKYGFSQEEASDVFQEVCLELLLELPGLREPKALPHWLARVASHKCFNLKRRRERLVAAESAQAETAGLEEGTHMNDEVAREAEREQMLRDALTGLSPRCRDLIGMLFFENPARPYREIADTLGLATGSIGFIRGRCLEQLRRRLEKMGIR